MTGPQDEHADRDHGSVRQSTVRLTGIVGLAAARLRHQPGRTTLAIAGVALAVLSMTLLVGVGAGVVETGDEAFDRADRDLWLAGGPVQVAPTTAGGLNSPITDSHELAAELNEREEIDTAAPMAFQTILVGTPEMIDQEEYDRLVGTGVPGEGGTISYTAGDGLSASDHYAGGDYDGPMSEEVVIDPETAAAYDLNVGDTIHVGGSVVDVQQNAFTVVGISPTYADLTGEATVTMHLSELQTLTGTSGTDEALFVTITLSEDADTEAVQRDLQEAYPQYEVRTNQEQLTAVLEEQALLIAAGISLVVLAVLGGAALTANILSMAVHQQRRELGALRSLGVSRNTVVWMTCVQGLAYAVTGAMVGFLLTPVAAAGLDALAASMVGFEGLVQVPTQAYTLGFVAALVIGTLSAGYGGWRAARTNPLVALDQ